MRPIISATNKVPKAASFSQASHFSTPMENLVARYGRRLLPHLIDELAQSGHRRPYASIPTGLNPSDGYLDVPIQAFANGINRCATWIKDRFGKSKSSEVLVYLGPADLRYNLLAVAVAKTGYSVSIEFLKIRKTCLSQDRDMLLRVR